jgi:23S rRNA pseudouridine2605 synthase
MRLAKFLAHAGIASRRAAEDIIRDGRVTVKGEQVTDPARDVDDSSGVQVDGNAVRPARERLVYAVHKPAGIVSTAKDTHGRPTVVELVPKGAGRLYPVGRLDADTTGLILLTNDGELAHGLTHPRFGVRKVYRARISHPPIGAEAIQRLREGVELDDGRTAPAGARRLAPDLVEITITEGRKRQVRRMLDAVGHPVRELRRVAFGPLHLGDLAPGAARRLKASEVETLRRAVSGRSDRSGSRRPHRRTSSR